jgi:hypothetical protein
MRASLDFERALERLQKAKSTRQSERAFIGAALYRVAVAPSFPDRYMEARHRDEFFAQLD